MTNRLNGRTITTTILILAVCGGAIAYMMFSEKSIDSHIADGDQYVVNGNHKKARQEFESALAKSNRDLGRSETTKVYSELLIKFVDAASLEEVDDASSAQTLVRLIARSLKDAVAATPQDDKLFQRLMDLQMYRTLVLHEFSVWREIYATAHQIIQTRPEMPAARKYRGIAHVRLLNAGLPPTGTHRHEARTDLEQYFKDHPDDHEGDYHLAWWHMLNADQLASEDGVPEEQISEAQTESLRLTDATRKRWPQSVQAQLQHATMLLTAGRADDARAIVLEQEQKMIENPSSAQTMLLLTDLIIRIEPANTPDQRNPLLERIAAACETAFKAQPDELLFEVIRARALARTGADLWAIQILDDIRQRPLNAVPLEATRLTYVQSLALIDHANLLLDKAEQEMDPAKSQETIVLLDGLMKNAESLLRGSVSYFMIAGRSAALRGRWSEAVQHFRSANEQLNGSNVTAQLRFADALDKVGLSEEAIPILEGLLTSGQLANSWPVRYQLTQIMINSRHFQDAKRHLDILRRNDSEDERLLAMESVLANNWITLAKQQRESGDLDAALESAHHTVKLAPKDLAAIRMLATVHRDRGEHEDALEQMGLAHSLQPENAQFRNQYARYEQQFGSKEMARQRREEWVEKYPDDLDNRRSLVLLLSNLDEYDEARRVLEKLNSDHGQNLRHAILAAEIEAQKGDVDAGRQILEQYVQDLGDAATVDDWIGLARYLFDYKSMDVARDTYDQAIAADATPTMYATRDLAARLSAVGKPDKAEPLYRQLYERFPNDQRVAEGLTQTLIVLGKADEARPVVEHIIKINGASATTYLFESDLAAMSGNLDEAIARLEQASILAPNNGWIHFHIGRLLAGVGDRSARAIISLKRALDINPMLLDARNLLAKELLKGGDIDQAIDQLQMVVQQDPMQARARDQLGDLYVQTDRLDEARQLLEESAQMFPDDPRWPRSLVKVARRQSNLSEASDHLKRVFELDPSPATLRHGAVELIEAGQFDDALTLMDQNDPFLEADPLLHAVRGWSLARLGQTADAHEAYGKALAACKTYAQIERVTKHLQSGLEASEARTLLENARVPENDVIVSLALGELEIHTGQFDLAIARLKQIESQLPQYSPNRLPTERALAAVLHQSGDKKSAHEIYQQILNRAPRDVSALCGMAWIYSEALGQADQALRFAELAVKADMGDAQAHAAMGWVQFRQGNIDKSLQTLRRSLQMDRSAVHCLYLGRVLMTKSDETSITEALDMLNEAVRLAGQTGDAHVEKRAQALIEKLKAEGAEESAEPASASD